MYVELLQPPQGGSLRVCECLVWGGGEIVSRNIRESSEEVRTPSVGRDVHRPHRLALTRKADVS
jgi:hypothetical protein